MALHGHGESRGVVVNNADGVGGDGAVANVDGGRAVGQMQMRLWGLQAQRFYGGGREAVGRCVGNCSEGHRPGKPGREVAFNALMLQVGCQGERIDVQTSRAAVGDPQLRPGGEGGVVHPALGRQGNTLCLQGGVEAHVIQLGTQRGGQ